MKKNLLNWMTILMVAIVSVGFVSCGDDDDEDEKKIDEVTIIGTWRLDYSSGYELLTFNSNGKGTLSEYNYEGKKEILDEIEAFDYIFNESTMTLRILAGDEVEIWKVESLTSTQMIIDGDVYVKQ